MSRLNWLRGLFNPKDNLFSGIVSIIVAVIAFIFCKFAKIIYDGTIEEILEVLSYLDNYAGFVAVFAMIFTNITINLFRIYFRHPPE